MSNVTTTSSSLTLKISAATAIEQFRAMKSGANELTAAIAELNRVGAGGAAGGTSAGMTRLRAELGEVRAALKANQMQTESLQRALDEQSKANLAGIARETAAIKEKNKIAREEIKRTSQAQGDADAMGAAARLPTLRSNGLSFPGGKIHQGSSDDEIQQVADVQRLAVARAATAAAAEMQRLNLAGQRAQELAAIASTDRLRVINAEGQRQLQYRELTKNEALAALNAAGHRQLEYQQLKQNEKLGELNAIGHRQQEFQKLAAQARYAELNAAGHRQQQLQEAANQAKLQAINDAGFRAQEYAKVRAAAAAAPVAGTERSALRGAALAAGAQSLTYGQNIPALAATFAAGTAIKESIKEGASFQQEMAFVRVASEDSAESIAKVSKEVLAMASNSIYGPIEMAKGLRMLTQAGFETKDAMLALTPVMNMATLGETTVGQASEIAQGLMHAFGLEAKDIGRIGDVMAKAANISATNVRAMGEAMKQSSTVAQQYNVSIEDQGALLAVLAKKNITGSAAGTALINMFRELDPFTVKAQRAFKQLGITVDDGTGSYKKIIPLVQELAQKLNGMTDIKQGRFLQDAFNNRGMKAAFNAIADANADLPKFFDQLMHASDGAGYMARSIAIVGDTAQKSFDKLKSAASAAFIGAFDSAETKKTLESLRKLVNDPEFQEGLKSLVGNFSKFVNLVGDNGGTISAAVGSYVLFAKVIPTIGTGVSGLIAAADGAIAGSAIVAAGGGLGMLKKHGGLLGVAFFGGWQLGDWLGNIESIRGAISGLFDAMEASRPKDLLGKPTAELDQRIKELDAKVATGRPGSGEYNFDRSNRFGLAAERVALYRKMGLDASGRPTPAAIARTAIDAFEIDGRQGSGWTGARPGSVGYDRLNPIEEAVKKAKVSEQEAAIKRALTVEEQVAKQSLSILDAKHKYGLMAEDEYIRAVEDLEDKRAIKERLNVDVAVREITGKIKAMKGEADQIRATTTLRDLQAKGAVLQSDAEFIAEQRRLKIEGERAVRTRANKAEVAGHMADFGKLVEQQSLAQFKTREGIENAIRPGRDAAQIAARMGVEQAYLTSTEALKRSIAEFEEKADIKSLERVENLRPLLGLLEQQKKLQSDVAASEAASNYDRQRQFTYGWAHAYQQYVESSTNAAQQARDVFGVATRGMEGLIFNFAKTGKLSFRDFGASVVDQLLKIQAAEAATVIMGGAKSLLGFALSRIGGGGAATVTGAANIGASDLGGVIANVGHTGGTVGSLTAFRSASPSMFAGAPRFHTGGLVGDEMPIIAKRGEGVFTREQMAALAPAGSSGGVTIQININARTGESDTKTTGDGSAESMKMLGARMATVAREEIQRQQRPNGLLASRGRG
ncbi:MAG: phage-related tail protein [Frankiales bacterium]|nr:phage-related tail protein [Frankiales bacterium]